MRILLVEDNLEISEVMTVYCGFKKDIDCKVVNSGQEGLERIRNENFDLILLDLAMPEFSGKDVIQSFTEGPTCTKEHCHLYRFIRSPGLRTNEKYRCQRDIQKTIFITTINRIDREISACDNVIIKSSLHAKKRRGWSLRTGECTWEGSARTLSNDRDQVIITNPKERIWNKTKNNHIVT